MKKTKRPVELTGERLEQIKRLVIIAMFSDSALEELLVLKGGNAIDIVHRLGARASVDVDFSMHGDLPEAMPDFRDRVERALKTTFSPEGYDVFDVKLAERPETISEELKAFWGGYTVEFKLLDSTLVESLNGDLNAMRRH